MTDALSDAELVNRLKLVREHKTLPEAAAAAGCKVRTFRDSIANAKARGLTADTKIRDPLQKALAEVAALKAQVRDLQRSDDTAAAIREEIWKLEAYRPETPAWLLKGGANGFRGIPFLLGSDWHYGEVVSAAETGGLNVFNSEIAAARVKRMISTTIDLCYNHMGRAKTVYPGIVFALGGDMISGDIHEELMVSNDKTPHQAVNELTDLIGSAIETLATKFGHVYVPCVTGNHGRSTKRLRFKGRVFSSFEWNIYCNLEREFRRNNQVTFNVAEQTDIHFPVYNHRYLLTHGDTLGVKGGDGIIGALGPIRRGEIKIRNAESQVARDFDTIVMGHWHQYLTLPGLIVNNALKGYDEYARSALRAPYSRPSQALWFTHPEHGITAHWQVYLEDARVAAPAADKSPTWMK